MVDNSKLLSINIGLMYPFIILFGIYVVVNGHISPGGGFQGGAVLSAVFMSRYLVRPTDELNLSPFKLMEKTAFVLLVTVVFTFFLTGANIVFPMFRETYMIMLNSLISIKVCCGLSIVFFRFAFYESR